jgi:hypothetical protein
MLFIYAVEENWKKCKELKADLENNVANLCGYSEWLYNSALLVCSVEKPDDLEAGWLWRCKDKLSGWPGGKCMSLRRAKKDFKRIFRKYKKTAKLNQKLIN